METDTVIRELNNSHVGSLQCLLRRMQDSTSRCRRHRGRLHAVISTNCRLTLKLLTTPAPVLGSSAKRNRKAESSGSRAEVKAMESFLHLESIFMQYVLQTTLYTDIYISAIAMTQWRCSRPWVLSKGKGSFIRISRLIVWWTYCGCDCGISMRGLEDTQEVARF